MPSEVGITLGILQALYDTPIAFPKLHPTTLSQGRTLLHDLLVSLRLGGEGDVLLLYGVVSPMTSFAFLTLSACKVADRENSFAIHSAPKRCLKWTQSLAAQGGPHWKVASPVKYWS
jgi:hypothetical protein